MWGGGRGQGGGRCGQGVSGWVWLIGKGTCYHTGVGRREGTGRKRVWSRGKWVGVVNR